MNPEPTAGVLGPRSLAAIIDIAILGAVFILLAALTGGTEGDTDEGASFNVSLSGAPALLFFAFWFAYYIVQEALWGATIGKRLLGLRVIRDVGPIGWGPAALRTLLRIVDFLPFFYLLGFILVAARSDGRRLGDMAAGTSVVRASRAAATG